MDTFKKLILCTLSLLLIGIAKAAPPDWVKITTKPLHVEWKKKGYYPLSELTYSFEFSITNNSSFRAILGLKNMTYTISGHVEVFNPTEKKWENESRISYTPLPKFNNIKLLYGDRDVEIMPGATYKQVFTVKAIYLYKTDAKYYDPAWFRLYLTNRFLDFTVTTREVSTIKTASDPGHRR